MNKEITNFEYDKKKKIWITISSIFVFLFFVAGIFLYKHVLDADTSTQEILNINQEQNNTNAAGAIIEKRCNGCVRRNIDGVYVPSGQENLYPLAVMIDNHIDARPPSGLPKASLFYEAEAEGGITRFLAFFAGNDIEEIGPIRSARPYFVEWAQELSALYTHVGGSPDALLKISRENVLDINEFFQGKYFWRDSKKDAPHNVYTSSENLKKYLDNKGVKTGQFLSWPFKADDPAPSEAIQNDIKIIYRTADFMVQWKYNGDKNDYARFEGGKIHQDVDGTEIKAKNVIIMKIKSSVVDDKLRLNVNTVGSDKAIVCLDGKCQEGIWKKTDISARTHFYNNQGEEFKFNAGTTWIEVVKPEYNVSY